MLKWYFILTAWVCSLNLKNELGTLYLTEEEPYTLSLSDYFSGDNLSFSISDTNMTNNSATVENQCEFNLLSTTIHQNYNKTKPFSNTQTLIMWQDLNIQIIAGFAQNYLAIYNFSTLTQETKLMWNTNLLTEFTNPQIEDITYLGLPNWESHLALIVKQQENNELWRNDIYIIRIQNLKNFQEPKRSNFNEIAYASKIVVGHGNLQKFFPIYCESYENSNMLYIYEISNIFEPILHQTILKYEKILVSNSLSIKSIITNLQNIVILDSNYGVIALYKAWPLLIFEEESSINLSHFGELYSMERASFLKWTVRASSGLLVIERVSGTLGISKFWKNHEKDNWIRFHDFSLYSLLQSSSGKLSIYSKSNKSQTEILYSIDLKRLDQGGDRNIPEMLSSWDNNFYYYQRFEIDGLKTYQISLKEWKLKITGGSFYVEIKAKDNNSNEISDNLNVISIPKNSYQIFALDKGRPKVPKPSDIDIYQKNSTLFFPVSNYFSGPNLRFEFVFPYTEKFKYETSTVPNIELHKNIACPDGLRKFLIHYSMLVYFYDDKILFEDKNNFSLTYNINNPINYLEHKGTYLIIYSRPSESSFLISILLNDGGRLNLIEEIESEIECVFFDVANNHLLCGNNEQIDIYDWNEYWKKVWSLTSITNNVNLKLNIADIVFQENKNLLYIVDKNLGFFVISIADQQNLIKFELKTQGLLKIISFDDKIWLISDDKVAIYNLFLQHVKTIIFKTDGPIINAFAYNPILFIQKNKIWYAYDTSQLSHSAFAYSFNIPNEKIISYGLDDFPNFLIGLYSSDAKFIEIYKISYNEYRMEDTTGPIYKIDIIVSDPNSLQNLTYYGNFSVIAYNDYDKLELSFPLTFHVDGSFPWIYNNITLSQNLPFNEEFEIDLSDKICGQDLSLSLNINGINTSDENINLPAFIPKRIEVVGEYQASNSLIKDHIIIIPQTEIVLMLNDNGFIIVNSSGFKNEGKGLNISEHTKLNSLVCSSMESFQHTKQNLVLIATSCTYQTTHEHLYVDTSGQFSNQNAIILWELDYINSEITNYSLTKIVAKPWCFRIASLNEVNFELMLITEDILIFDYKDVLRYRGNWTENLINIQLVETINFYSLGLPSFFPMMLDFKVKNSETNYWYFADRYYGIRVLKTDKDLKSSLVGGVPKTDQHSYFKAIGICGDTLYVSSFLDAVTSYKIKDHSDFERKSEYKIAQGQEKIYIGAFAFVTCSADERYIAIHTFNSTLYFLSIFDTNSQSNSNHIANLYVAKPEHSPRILRATFINENEILVPFYSDYLFKWLKINKNSLVFPKINENEYSDMNKEWGTENFSMIITAENINNNVCSSTIYFTRQTNSESLLQSNLLDYSYWLIRFITLIAILVLFIASVNFAKRIGSKHKKGYIEKNSLKMDIKLDI